MQAIPKNEPKSPEAKTVGVKVEPSLYADLKRVQKKHGVKSLRQALLYAAKVGVKALLADP